MSTTAATATICEAFQQTVREHADDVALRTPGDVVHLTWGEVGERVERIAGALAGLGVRRGDSVALMLTNRPEFHLVDLAALHLGATAFSMYNTSPPEQIAHILRNAESKLVVTEDLFLDVIGASLHDAPLVESVVSVEDGDGAPALLDLPTPADFDFVARWRGVEPDDVASLIYTSGTTGPPKGVQLSHRNLLAAAATITMAIPALARPGRVVSYLPHAHIADRMLAHYLSILAGSSITTVSDPREIVGALPDVRPTTWLAVPRIWEKLKAAVEPALTGEESPEALAALRARLGLDSAEVLLTGAAPIGVDVLEFFASVGLEILEVYGMSETTAVITINPPDAIRFGTVGPAAPGVQLRLAPDGEVLARGDVVMVGYRGQPQETAETIDDDGWLHTGDLGQIDDDGYLRIIDRKKEIIINAAGKNMSPANIETTIKSSSPLIGQVVVIGDGRPYNVALLVLDPDVAAAYAAKMGLADASVAAVAADPGVREMLDAAVAQANERLSRVEQLKRWSVLGEAWEPGGPQLTPTMKLKRKPIAERYASEIEALYTG